MIYLLYTIHVLVSIFLILVVLLQQGKGADLSVFSGGTTQAAFGVRGATTLLHKLTVASFILFILTTMSIALMQANANGGASVMESVAKQERKQLTEPTEGVTEKDAEQARQAEEGAAKPAAAEAPAEQPAAAGDQAPEGGKPPANDAPKTP